MKKFSPTRCLDYIKLLTTSLPRLTRQMSLTVCLIAIAGFTTNLMAQTYTTTGVSHNWDDPDAWTCQGGGCKATPGDKLNGGAKVFVLDSIHFAGSQLQTINAKITISNGAVLFLNSANLLIENNKNKGSLEISDGSLRVVGGNVENRGIVELTNAYVETSGNFTSENSVAFDSACIQVTGGNFENLNGEISGSDGNVKVDAGNIVNTGVWQSGIAYCAEGSISAGLPGAEDCDSVGIRCECLRVPCAIPNPDILPGYETLGDIVSPGLISLAEGTVNDSLEDDLFLLETDKVIIEINFKNRAGLDLILAKYPAGPIIYDGAVSVASSNVLTLYFPVADLIDLDTTSDHKNSINAVTQAFPSQGGPISNAAEFDGTSTGAGNIAVTGSSLPNQGDFGQESFFARAGYDITGAGINVGVLSDSYDKGGGGSAALDIAAGYLPGDPNDISIVNELSISSGIDEGRAMMQIIHSVAPDAKLFFSTGFEGPGNMAESIISLANDYNCQVISDDITHPGQPFFGTGVVGEAIDNVTTNHDVLYFTSAGNFADRAWSDTYLDLNGLHDFGGGNTLQKVNLGVGPYLIILQWDDEFFSLLGDGPGGARNDFDIFLADDLGNPIYNFSRNNLGDDPVEVLPFYVQNATTTNIVIKRVAGTDSPQLKYIVFKAGDKNQGFSLDNPANYGKGTITGHAQSASAITVGAVRYDNTPTFGGMLETQGFSSRGDLGLNKPDFTAVNGGNIGFDLGGGDYDDDQLPNFFGTSASAPHAAAVAALLLEAKDKFSLGIDVSTQMKSKAIDYGEPATAMGAGFLSAYNTLLGTASPSPIITKLDTSAFSGVTEEGGTLVIEGEFFVDGTTEVYFRDQLLTPTEVTDTTITVDIAPYNGGNPAIWVLNTSADGATGDGGVDTAYFSDPVLEVIDIIANDATKRYGEELPVFSFHTERALSTDEVNLLAPFIEFSTVATALTEAEAFLPINPVINTSIENLPPELTELYQFNLVPGNIYVAPMELKIVPTDFTVAYGSPIRDQIDYNLEFGTPENPHNISASNLANIESSILAEYTASQANDLLILSDISLSNISLSNISLSNFISLSNISLSNISLSNLLEGKSFVTSFKTLKNISLSNISLSNISLSNISLSNNLNSGAVPIDVSLFEQSNQWDGGTDFGTTYSDVSIPNISLSNISLSNFISLSNSAAIGSQLNISLSNISLSNISLSNFISLSNISA